MVLMNDTPKPRPPATRPPFDYTLLGDFTVIICGCDGWMIAGYGVARATVLWEQHADVDGCSTWQMLVGQ